MKNSREQLITIGKIFYQKGFLVATDGNFSCKLDDNTVLITPSGKAKYNLKTKDLVLINLEGQTIKGDTPSSEIDLHLEVYKNCPQALFVFHAHPPKAISCSLIFENKLPSEYLPEVILTTGDIPIVDYAKPGTKSIAKKLKAYLPEKKVLILSHHGALTWGENFEEAHYGMERLEHSASVLFDSFLLGKPKPLKKQEVKWLYEKRKEIGHRTL